ARGKKSMINIVVAGFKGKMGMTATKMVIENEKFALVGVYDPHATERNLNELNQFSTRDVRVFQDKEALGKDVQADVWIGFAIPDVALKNTCCALEHNSRPAVGTSGFSESDVKKVQQLAKEKNIGGLIAPNFAIGAVLMMEFAAKAAQY